MARHGNHTEGNSTASIGVVDPQNPDSGTVPASSEEVGTVPPSVSVCTVKVSHAGMEGKKITLPSGTIAAFDENGILEIESDIAKYLLSIPGYKKV
jgi:hypothetical protein